MRNPAHWRDSPSQCFQAHVVDVEPPFDFSLAARDKCIVGSSSLHCTVSFPLSLVDERSEPCAAVAPLLRAVQRLARVTMSWLRLWNGVLQCQ